MPVVGLSGALNRTAPSAAGNPAAPLTPTFHDSRASCARAADPPSSSTTTTVTIRRIRPQAVRRGAREDRLGCIIRAMPSIRRWTVYALIALAATTALAVAQQSSFKDRSLQFEKTGLADPFKGVTTDGKIAPGLYAIKSTGVSTDPVRKAAEAFLA